MVRLNISILVSEEQYAYMMQMLKDASNNTEKADLEEFIADALEYDIEENSSQFLFD